MQGANAEKHKNEFGTFNVLTDIIYYGRNNLSNLIV
jgi:hypothetical protein